MQNFDYPNTIYGQVGKLIKHVPQHLFTTCPILHVSRLDPDYRGKPLVVGGSPNERGVVAAASYEARVYGIHSAMPSRLAIAKCPGVIFVKPRFEVYRAISTQIRAIFERYTDFVEPVALDEAYLDVTENKQNIPYASTIARHIKAAIEECDRSQRAVLYEVRARRGKPSGAASLLQIIQGEDWVLRGRLGVRRRVPGACLLL